MYSYQNIIKTLLYPQLSIKIGVDNKTAFFFIIPVNEPAVK